VVGLTDLETARKLELLQGGLSDGRKKESRKKETCQEKEVAL
jgi:hypothetical protein